jgi:hypothetical protein
MFEGVNPKIWLNKCNDYFRICNLPEIMWVTAASLHEENAARWWQVFKVTQGADDYRQTTSDLLEYKQLNSVEEYAKGFEDMRYVLLMHSTGLGEMFFVSHL